MQSKPIAAIIVLLLVVASLLVSGCTVEFPKAPLPTPPPKPDSQLTQYIEAYHQTMEELHPTNLSVFRVAWRNSTTAQIQTAFTYIRLLPNTTSDTESENATIIKFRYADEATRYVYAHTTGYFLSSTTYPQNDTGLYPPVRAYEVANHLESGNGPSVYAYYRGVEGTSINGTGRHIEQVGEYLWFVDYDLTNATLIQYNLFSAS
jgi:outer membrane PBP1 activator LpoA protein